MPGFQSRWSTTPRRHPKSTPLSRYWKDTPPFSAMRSHPVANVIYSALCEVTGDEICNPIRLCISPNASVMHLSSAGGWKDRSPVSSFWNLNDDTAEGFQSANIDVGLKGIVYHSVIEDDRKLIWVADEDRVKSFAWPNTSTSDQKALPMHTLDSPCRGPLHATNDRVFRAGKGFAATWKIDELETHGPDGDNAIGQMDGGSDGEDEDENDIEHSKGSQSTARVTFSNTSLEPSYWAPHPSKAGHMLCVSDSARSEVYSCHALDLESGKIVDNYLGHGGTVNNISTSAADPNVFLTSSDDGYVRLFDTRHHLPVLTLNVGKSSDGCDAAVLCHPDGVPSIFTGSGKTEHITLWDVRAKTACYELATGNNAVHSMVWDSARNTLYAATECRYIDRLGRNYDYRPARIPRDQRGRYGADDDGNDDDEDLEDDDEDLEDDRAWPKDAFHGESYFGYTFDAARHTIFKYHFKADANTDIVPEDGQATVGDGDGW
ncbi:hypothetical protein FIBSPDRAFT_735589 [Athelia psychrophila]|uniref:WD40 repeat-like protein n=1 Tax=Athelia psychrophila TaxID=1759441 RepID=A0A166N2A8_9AGAM|nr:hypothetical protein FIBSPDRAFT_735589 [Fibularhizoctonia sp. CBS 109695]